MSPEKLLAALQAYLDTFVEGWGSVSLAGDPYNVYEQLTQGPNSTLIILHWAGDEPAGSTRASPFAKNEIEVYVGRNRGLSLDPNENLVHTDIIDGQKPLFQEVAEIREHLRAFQLNDMPDVADIAHEPRLSYGGTGPVILPNGIPMAALRIRFNVNASLPNI